MSKAEKTIIKNKCIAQIYNNNLRNIKVLSLRKEYLINKKDAQNSLTFFLSIIIGGLATSSFYSICSDSGLLENCITIIKNSIAAFHKIEILHWYLPIGLIIVTFLLVIVGLLIPTILFSIPYKLCLYINMTEKEIIEK